MVRPLYIAAAIALVLLMLAPLGSLAQPQVEQATVEPFEELAPPLEKITPVGPQPRMVIGDHTFGDTAGRVFIVHEEPLSWRDDLAMTALVPIAVHWEGSTCYRAPLLTDNLTGDGRNVLSDYAAYLEKVQIPAEVFLIGDVGTCAVTEICDIFGINVTYTRIDLSDDLSQMSVDLAEHFFYDARPAPVTEAVVVPVPEQYFETMRPVQVNFTFSGQWNQNVQIDASNTSWMETRLTWDDPEFDTDYGLVLTDPFAATNSSYTTEGMVSKVNPTNNDFLSGQGVEYVSTSPYYSYQVYQNIDAAADSGYSNTASSVGAGQNPGSNYPVWPFGDTRTIQLGPFYEGQRIHLKTTWPYSTIVALDTFVYLDDNDGEDFDKEIMMEPSLYWDDTPEAGSYIMPKDGYINVTIHAWSTSAASSFTLEAWWDALGPDQPYLIQQPTTGTDNARVEIVSQPFINTSIVEAVTNGAVMASLRDCPLLFTNGEPVVETEILDLLDKLGILELHLMDPGSSINDTSGWQGNPFTAYTYLTDTEMMTPLVTLCMQKTGRMKAIIAPLGGPWMASAAYAGAYWGAPVPAADDLAGQSWVNDATAHYWSMIQHGVEYGRTSSHENTVPSREDMQQLSDDFFSWLGTFSVNYDTTLNDPDGDGTPTGSNWDYSNDVDVFVVSPMSAIKPTLDRAIVGKANVGRAPYEGLSQSMAGLSRSALYWELVFTNATDPHFKTDEKRAEPWNTIAWTFVAYTHDDENMDDDLGDEVDDDLCWEDDGGANHISYHMSDDLPTNATDNGYVNVYDTYYTNVTDSLQMGAAFWMHADHGSYNNMFETGSGLIGLSQKSANPWRDYEAGADESDPDGTGDTLGLVNPPTDNVAGLDLYYDIHRMHSTMVYYQDCMYGASRGPLYMMDRGAVSAVGDMYSMAIAPSPVFNDRYSRGLFEGMELGEAYRWGLDESADMYSTKDEGPSVLGFTMQTVLNGDPTLTLAARTLYMYINWTMPVNGSVFDFNIRVVDHYGTPHSPNTITATIAGNPMTLVNTGTGTYTTNWTFDGTVDPLLVVTATSDEYRDKDGSTNIVRQKIVHTPVIDTDNVELTYRGKSIQTLDVAVLVTNSQTSFFPLDEDTIVKSYYQIFHDEGYLVDTGNLTFSDNKWKTSLNISWLPAGKYNVSTSFTAHNLLKTTSARTQFTVDHMIWFEPSHPHFDSPTATLYVNDIRVRSSWSDQANLTPSQTRDAYWQLFRREDPDGNFTGFTSALEFNTTTELWSDVRGGLEELPQEQYFIHIAVVPEFCPSEEWTSDLFTIADHFHVEGLKLDYVGGMTQTISLFNLTVLDQQDKVMTNPSVLASATYGFYTESDPMTVYTGDLDFNNSLEIYGVDVSHLPEGNASVWCNVTLSNGQAFNVSDDFSVSHVFEWDNPWVSYKGGEKQYINLSGLQVRSSYSAINIVGPNEVSWARFDIRRETVAGSLGSGIKGDLAMEQGNQWGLRYESTKPLPEDTYFVEVNITVPSSKGGGQLWLKLNTGNFTVEHVLEGSSVDSIYRNRVQTVDVWGLWARSTYAPFTEVNASNAAQANYTFHHYDDPDGAPVYGSPTGHLNFINGSWEARNIYVGGMDVGTYVIKCNLLANNWKFNATGKPFIMEYALEISDPDWWVLNASEQRLQILYLENVTVNCPAVSIGEVEPGEATRYEFRLLKAGTTHTYYKGDMLYNVSRGWYIELKVSTFPESGDYVMNMSFKVSVSRVAYHEYNFSMSIYKSSPEGEWVRDDDDKPVSMLPCIIGLVIILVLIIAVIVVLLVLRQLGKPTPPPIDTEAFDYDCPECGAVVFSDEKTCAECGVKLTPPAISPKELYGDLDEEYEDEEEVEGEWDEEIEDEIEEPELPEEEQEPDWEEEPEEEETVWEAEDEDEEADWEEEEEEDEDEEGDADWEEEEEEGADWEEEELDDQTLEEATAQWEEEVGDEPEEEEVLFERAPPEEIEVTVENENDEYLDETQDHEDAEWEEE